MPRKISVEEIRAVAEAAVTASYAATAAKTALDADPENQTLKDAHATAEQAAKDAKAKADALSQGSGSFSPEQIAKKKRKISILQNELRTAGELDADIDDDTDDDLDLDDPNRPVTFADLRRIEVRKGTQSAKQLADAIEDPLLRNAVKDALAEIVPSGNPEADLRKAAAIANIDKNSKILEEFGRRPVPQQFRSGSGAPAHRDDAGAFEPTAEEASYMKSFGLTKEDILKARAQSKQS